MLLKKKFLIPFLCILFSLDSLVKLSLPALRIHPAHLLIIIFSGLLLTTPNGRFQAYSFIKDNKAISMYIALCLLQSFQAKDITQYIFVLTYPVIMMSVFYYFYTYRNSINFNKTFKTMTLIVIFGGIAQYLLNLLFGYQLALGGIDTAYYLRGTSVEGRMRGFFLEPNWFGLFLTFSFIGYALTLERIKQRDIVLFVAVMVCAYLSGNRLSNYFLVITFAVAFFSKRSPRLTLLAVFLLGLLPLVYFISSVDFFFAQTVDTDDRSLAARTITASRTVSYMISNFEWYNWLFGHGLSNWSNIALNNGLTIRSEALSTGQSLRDTSESYILMIEHGVLGCLILLIDSALFIKKSYFKGRALAPYAAIATMFLLTSTFFYPIFFFMMYLVPYLLIRIYFLVNHRSKHQ